MTGGRAGERGTAPLRNGSVFKEKHLLMSPNNVVQSKPSLWRRNLRMALRVLAWAPICLLVFMLLSILLHTFGHYCPLSFSIVHRDEEKPVLYGLVYPGELDPAWEDKVALGGCAVMPISTICPRCGWPMRYGAPSTSDAMPDLDMDAAFGSSLSESARASVQTHIAALKSAPLGDATEAVVAAAVGGSSLWVATRHQGLHRMDLESGVWSAQRTGQPWRCFVKAIAIQGVSVQVEYSPFGAQAYFQTATTLDEGRTWQLTSGPLPLLP